MASDNWNGSTVSIAAADQTPLISCSYSESAAAIDITGGNDTLYTQQAGIPDPAVTLSVHGLTSVDCGNAGAVSVAWFDGTTDTLTDGVVVSVSIEGELDGAITSEIKLRPNPA